MSNFSWFCHNYNTIPGIPPGPGTGPDPDPDPDPKCNPYSCSAYETAVAALEGPTFTPLFKENDDPWDWPFAEDSGDTNKYRAYNSFIDAPTILSDWGGDPGTSAFAKGTPYAWATEGEPDFCGGEVRQCLNVKFIDSGVQAVLLPESVGSSSLNTASHMIISGHNGGELMSGTLQRSLNKRFYCEGTLGYFTHDARVHISTETLDDPPGLQVQTLTLEIPAQGGSGYPGSSASIPLGRIGHRWSSVSASIGCGVSVVGKISQYTTRLVMNVSVTARIKTHGVGLSEEVTLDGQLYFDSTTGDGSIPAFYSVPNTLYTQTRLLYASTLSCLSLGTVSFSDTYDLEPVEVAYERNYSDYVMPEYCDV